MFAAVSLLVALSSGFQTPAFQADTAFSLLKAQCAFGPRVPGTEPHVKCRDLIKSQADKYCDSANLQPFTHTWSQDGESKPMWNVIGYQNWEKAKVRIALFTHWDTRPYATEERLAENRRKPILGANDGASGTAILMELMRAMKGKVPEDLGIAYVFVDGEDLGPDIDEMFLGAIAYSKAPSAPKPDYGILLDMVGDKDLAIPMEPNSYNWAPNLVRSFYQLANRVGLGSTFVADWGPEVMDDHFPLNQSGIPTMDLIDFRYPAWHTLRDTPENCSAKSLGKVGVMLELWLTQKPTWVYKPR